MTISVTPIAATFMIAALITLAATPITGRIARKMGVLDQPDERKVHLHPTPRWGGIAIYLGVTIAVLAAFWFFPAFQGKVSPAQARMLWAILGGCTAMLIMGMIDDRWFLKAKLKLLIQILVAVVLVACGIRIDFVTNPLNGITVFPAWASALITILWLVGITNAINLLDGLDGLLAGVSTISASIFCAVTLLQGQWHVALIMAAVAGSCLAFLRYNFHPARIFMGDSGSLFLGICFAACSVVGVFKTTTTMALLIPLVVLGLPIFDTSFAIIRRARSHQPIFKPDKDHVHHRLLRVGYSHRRVVVLIYILNGVLGLGGLVLTLLGR